MNGIRMAFFVALVGTAAVLPTARAVTQARFLTVPAARLCTLSVPTTSTNVRPKATGFRNEGTTSAFVICAFDSGPGQTSLEFPPQTYDPFEVDMWFAALDGKAHTFTCTAVNSWPGFGVAFMEYVPKTVTLDPASSYYPMTSIFWQPWDFNWGDLTIPTSGALSVTCTLPPGVAILLGGTRVNDDVGN